MEKKNKIVNAFDPGSIDKLEINCFKHYKIRAPKLMNYKLQMK